ncbi:unnamed protein product [Urochloa humidicola]
MAHARGSSRASLLDRLPAEVLAEIHGRLGFVDRLALAGACNARSRLALKAEAPCLVLPSTAPERITVAAARATDPAMRGHAVLGSSSAAGWLVTADARGDMRMANPVTGEQADLPAITTIPFLRPLGGAFCLSMGPFAEIRFRGETPTADGTFGGIWWGGKATFTHNADQMLLWFYRKVVLSASPTPSPSSYAAMLILSRSLGAPAFATAEDPAWRLAPSRDGVEDAIHHDGRFYSVTYSGAVEAWDRDGGSGEFVSREAAPRLAFNERHLTRKYLAAALDGRLMAVLKYSPEEVGDGVSFKVQVLDKARRRWREMADIGDAALFVGVNGTLSVSAREYRGIRAGCIYFTEDDIGQAWLRHERQGDTYYRYGNRNDEVRDVGVYSLQSGKVERINITLQEHPRWPPAAWFTPSV